MRRSTAGWFAAGCGIAVIALGALAGAHAAVNAARSDASEGAAAEATLDALTPASDPASDDVAVVAPHAAPQWENVPVQRPHDLRGDSPVAPPTSDPFRPFRDDERNAMGDARLPSTEATLYWSPDDARMPGRTTVVARAYWNPDSATLPRARRTRRLTWNPDDARLPSL
ncbi:MAG: hypothetical protein ACE37F_27350 [Nannocystaceae bacterium]|nr:hypothetical protein [bacterium]